MRKCILALSLLLLLAQPVYGQMLNTVIAETDLTKGSSETTVTLATSGITKLTIFVKYSQNGTVPLDITLDASYDGTNWADANFHDSAGVGTLQTTEQLTTDIWYWLVWNNEVTTPYVRIHTIGNTWTAGSTATITVYTVQE